MKIRALRVYLTAALIVAGSFGLPVWASHDGICRTKTKTITNPYSKNPLEAWKLIGEGVCSGVRLSKEWIMGSAHCFYDSTNLADGIFQNEFGIATVDRKTCSDPRVEFNYATDPSRVNDFKVCRLVSSGTLPEPASYPILAVMPAFNAANAGRLGGMLIGGMSTWGIPQCVEDVPGQTPYHDQVGLVDLNGMDISRGTVNPATQVMGDVLPFIVDSDSGGGAYWLPANGQDPVLVGVISQVKPGGFQNVPWYFTADNLNKVVDYIKRVGKPTDQVPVIRTTPDYFVPSGPANSPAMMTAAPTVVATLPTSNSEVTVTWTPPATTPVVIDSYRVAMAMNGVLVSSELLAVGSSYSKNLVTAPNGQTPSANGRICVTPSSSTAGLATSAYAQNHSNPENTMYWAYPVLVGCTDFNIVEVPTAGVTSLASVIASRTGLSSTIRTTWLPRDTVAKIYRVKQTTSFSTGPRRVVTQDVSSTSISVSVTKGATLCTEVTPMSAVKRIAAGGSSTCLLSN